MKIASVIVFVVLFGVVAELTLLDGVLGVIAPLGFETDTAYSEGYSDLRFRAVSVGMTRAQLSELLGEPLWESWDYSSVAPACDIVWMRAGIVVHGSEDEACPLPPVAKGISQAELRRVRGLPLVERRLYSESPGSHSYRERIVVLVKGMVAERVSSFYID